MKGTGGAFLRLGEQWHSGRHGLFMALLLGLSLRSAWALLVPVVPDSDGAMYDAFARSIAAGAGYAYPDGHLTAYWPVGTPAVYGALYSLFGVTYTPIVMLNLLLGGGIIYLTWKLAARYVGLPTAAASAWLVAFWPLLIQFTTVLASELLFIFFLLAAIHVWGLLRLPVVARSAGWSALLSAAVYIRPTALPLFVILPAIEWWNQRDRWRVTALSALVAAFTAAALFAPWIVRNYEVLGGFYLVSTNFGENLWMGNNPQSTGAYMDLPEISADSELEREEHFKTAAMEYIKEHPGIYLVRSLKRFVVTFDRETIGVHWNHSGLMQAFGPGVLTPLKAWSTAYWLMVAAVGVVGLLLLVRGGQISFMHILILTPLLFVLVPVLTVGQDRYHLPVNPFVAIFAGAALSRWMEKV